MRPTGQGPDETRRSWWSATGGTAAARLLLFGNLAAGLVLGGCSSRERRSPAQAGEPPAAPAFWVWHRKSPLSESERGALRAAGVGRLYWQAAECEWRDGRWHSVEIARNIGTGGTIEVVPVFRLKPNPAFLGDPAAADALVRQIRAWWGKAEPLAEVQLDFDCPARVLGDYARFLTNVRRQLGPTRVSITALASWPDHPQFGALAAAADALAPMFYDLAADAAADAAAGRFKPMADPDAGRWIAKWRTCPVPWFAGLPNFERVSIFEADGRLVGHVRGWEHDPVLFHPALAGRMAGPGTTWFDVKSPAVLAGSPVVPGQHVVWRTVEGRALADLTAAVTRAGARGIIYFARPGPGLQAAFTAGNLTAPADEPARLALTLTNDGALVLENRGRIDLPARALDPTEPRSRGWALVLRAPGRGGFREAGPGEFTTTQTGAGLPAAEATALTLRFARLPAGASIRSSRCVANPDGIRWQVPGITGDQPVPAIR